MGRIALTLFTAILLACLGGALALSLAWGEFQAAGPSTEDHILIFDRGANILTVANDLADQGVLRSRWVFIAGALWQGDYRRLKPGEYRFPVGVTPATALGLIVSGQVLQHRLTVPEGLTVKQVYRLLAETPLLIGNLPEPLPPEGSLLPETYFYVRGDTRAALIDRMRRAMNMVLEEVWAGRDPGLPLADPRQAVILASIVERETADPSEQRLVAGVFFNRLAARMKLQSDPTVIYGASNGLGVLERDLTRADLDADTKWNTYRIDGLPPTPICNPGRAALSATLHPTRTKFLYFVASGTGGHVFAETLAEHNRNVADWRRKQQAQPATPPPPKK